MSYFVDSIGGYSFIYLRGGVAPAGMTLRNITRPGTDGVAYQQMGTRGVEFTLNGLTDCLSFSDAAELVSACLDLQGTLVTIIQAGVEYDNYLVLSVKPGPPKATGTAIGGTVGGSVRQPIDFQCIYGGT